jgi:ADP-ribose pyrophosphatase YjhB (NUDIX family)
MWRRRVTAHGVVRDGAGRVLLVPAAVASFGDKSAVAVASFGDKSSVASNDGWTLPGGTVEHGESPQSAATRLARQQTGLAARVRAARMAAADQMPRPGDVVLHTDRLIFDLVVAPGIRSLAHGARWFTPAELTGVRLPGYAAATLDAGVPTGDLEDPDEGWPVERGMAMDGAGRRVQRFSTYARATDGAGRILFAKIATGYPSAGRWHLPGGGTDVGEAPADALLREVAEETGQVGTVGRLLSVSHRHNPVARGWEGYPINWHTIRVVYEMAVDEPTEPRVTESAGSTAEAAWMQPAEIDRRALTDLASSVL